MSVETVQDVIRFCFAAGAIVTTVGFAGVVVMLLSLGFISR